MKVALQTTQCTAAGTGTGMLMAPLATVAGKPGFTDGEPLDEGVSVLARRKVETEGSSAVDTEGSLLSLEYKFAESGRVLLRLGVSLGDGLATVLALRTLFTLLVVGVRIDRAVQLYGVNLGDGPAAARALVVRLTYMLEGAGIG